MPLPVRHALRKLGRDVRDARRRRRIPAAIAAQRASISRTTLVKIEKGDPGVAIGIYATVLFVLGLADRLGDLAAPKNDPVGLQLDVRDARRRRRIPTAIAAQRASISRTTLVKIEKGDPGVAIGIYATVLFVLGLADRLGDLAAPKNDPVGLQLEEENLPQRIRVARSPKRTKDK